MARQRKSQKPLSAAAATTPDYAAQLRAQTSACRLRRSKFGTRKTLTAEQLQRVADEFDAESRALSAAKKLLDTRDPAYRAVTSVISRAKALWLAMTVPYPDPGIRLIRKDWIAEFNEKIEALQAELETAVGELDAQYAQLRQNARDRLGQLFNAGDYPSSIAVEFAILVEYPSIEPPAYLRNIAPALYEQQVQLIRARMEEAVQLTETAYIEKLRELVAHMVEKLTGQADGKRKIIRESAIANLQEFFASFKNLPFQSSSELEQLVNQAQQAMKGVDVEQLRAGGMFTANVTSSLTSLQETLDELMVARPRRAISLDDGATETTQPTPAAAGESEAA